MSGNYKKFELRVVYPPDFRAPTREVIKCPKGHRYTDEGIEEIIERAIDEVDRKYPWWEFRLVRRGANAATLVYAGLREKAKAGSTELVAKTAPVDPVIEMLDSGAEADRSESERLQQELEPLPEEKT